MDGTYRLNRFVEAQEGVYEAVVLELRSGVKYGHWMWYIFPQVIGLGMSVTSQRFAIQTIDEAEAYCRHPLLGSRLRECTRLVVEVSGRTARQIFGYTDSLKFRSCMTLFECATGDELFRHALVKYYDGHADELTIRALEGQRR